MNDDITDSGIFTWTGATTTTGNFTLSTDTNFTFTANGATWHPVIPDKNWMPYRFFEYEPKWHKKYARYKIQISTMWD